MVTITISTEEGIKIEGRTPFEVKADGFEGILSRSKAPRYRVYDTDGSLVCTVKRHFFSNNPFFVVSVPGDLGSVKVSQEMSGFKVSYCIGGRGYSYDEGSFEQGDIRLTKNGAHVAHFKARVVAEGVLVVLEDTDDSDAPWPLGIALAYGLMLAFLRRTLNNPET